MSKNELERIALDTLERLDREAQEARSNQDARITRIEKRVDDFGKQLTRLSVSLGSLEPLTDGLNNILPNGGKR